MGGAPGLTPGNCHPQPGRCALGFESGGHWPKGTMTQMAGTRSQILLARSCEGEAPVSSSLYPTLAW